jgi:hypothetical protein
MAYREPDPRGEQARAAAERLSRLADEGHEVRAAATANEARAAAHAASAHAREAPLRLERSVSRLGSFVGIGGRPAVAWVFAAGMLGLFLSCPLTFLVLPIGSWDVVPYAMFAGVVAMVVAALLFCAVSRRMLPRRARAALARVADLPFATPDYREALGRDAIATLRVRIELAGAAPPCDLVEGLVARARLAGRVKTGDAHLVLEVDPAPRPDWPFFAQANRGVHLFFLALAETVLVPLHEVHPIAAVRFGESTFTDETTRDVTNTD